MTSRRSSSQRRIRWRIRRCPPARQWRPRQNPGAGARQPWRTPRGRCSLRSRPTGRCRRTRRRELARSRPGAWTSCASSRWRSCSGSGWCSSARPRGRRASSGWRWRRRPARSRASWLAVAAPACAQCGRRAIRRCHRRRPLVPRSSSQPLSRPPGPCHPPPPKFCPMRLLGRGGVTSWVMRGGRCKRRRPAAPTSRATTDEPRLFAPLRGSRRLPSRKRELCLLMPCQKHNCILVAQDFLGT